MEKKERCGDLLLLGKGGDLIQKILVRLPVKSLGRFKMVSKSWCALIESPFFIDLHTTNIFNSSSSNKFGSFILLASVDKCLPKFVSKPSLIMLSSESESESVDSVSGSGGTTGSNNNDQDDDDDQPPDDDQLVFKLDSLGFPLPDFEYCQISQNMVIGSCNGLVCLYNRMLKQVSLWNPATGQLRILPKSITVIGKNDCPKDIIAFGFDVETKDYKVVLITSFAWDRFRPAAYLIECPCQAQVYSLSTDSWRLLEGIISLPGDPFFSNYPRETSGVVYLNGSCFFLAHFFHTKQRRCLPENDRFIISFDFTKEIFTPIQLPDHHRHQRLYLSCLGDKMALFTVCPNPPPRGNSPHYPDIYELPSPHANYSHYPEIYEPPRGSYYFQICCCEDYNIWVLDEQVSSSVDKESWRQLHSFQIEHQRPCVWSSPSCISDDGEFALLETRYDSTEFGLLGKKMKLYNLVTKEVIKDFLCCSSVMSKAYAYKPSLVSIDHRWKRGSSRNRYGDWNCCHQRYEPHFGT